MTIAIAMIAAVGSNGVIGAGNALPWHLPSDFAHFKRTTLGKPLIMGRRTFESIGRPLPGRTNIVVSRTPGFRPDGVEVAGSLDEALRRAEAVATADGATEIFIGGGGEIYREALSRAHRLYITHVAVAPEGDTSFPPIDPDRWMVVDEPTIEPNPRDTAAYRVKVYERR